MNELFTRTDRSLIGRWWWTVDRSLLVAILTLIVFGVALVTTASPPVATRINLSDTHFIIRHIIIVIPAIIIMIGVSLLDPKQIWRLGTVVFLGGLLSMMIIPFVGMDIKGAQRWLHLPGFSLQPSEFVKPAFAIVAAWFMAHQKQRPGFPGNILSAGLYLLVITLLMLQPDFGMTVVVTCMFAGQIFLAGLPFRYLLIFMIVALSGSVGVYFAFDHVRSRIDRFLNPASGDTYQIDRSLEAFANGGFLGTGPGQGEVKQSIPDAHADFIFSVAGEELGLLFTLPIVALFVFILWRGFNRLTEKNDMFVVLAAGGILTMFGLQALIHMGSSLHLLPTKGMTLPFLSYGGSSTLSMGFSMGVVLALTRHQARMSIARSGLSLARKRIQYD